MPSKPGQGLKSDYIDLKFRIQKENIILSPVGKNYFASLEAFAFIDFNGKYSNFIAPSEPKSLKRGSLDSSLVSSNKIRKTN